MADSNRQLADNLMELVESHAATLAKVNAKRAAAEALITAATETRTNVERAAAEAQMTAEPPGLLWLVFWTGVYIAVYPLLMCVDAVSSLMTKVPARRRSGDSPVTLTTVDELDAGAGPSQGQGSSEVVHDD